VFFGVLTLSETGVNRDGDDEIIHRATRTCAPAWKSAVAELARCPNIVAKVGGIQMVVNGYGWHERKQPPTSDELLAANRDWYLYMIDRFTPERCMFESNFPVDRLSCSYTVLWNQFKKLTKDFSASERSAMFHDTASRVYRLPRS
jgi:predicted TIM-barrel fold metal-dependent hydrolase